MLPGRQEAAGRQEATTAQTGMSVDAQSESAAHDGRWQKFVAQFGAPSDEEQRRLPPEEQLYRPLAGLVIDLSTLCDATVWQRWVLKLLQQIGLHTQYRCVFKIWELDYLDDVQRGIRPLDEAFGHFLQAIGLNSGQIDEVATASLRRYREAEQSARVFPGVHEALAALHGADFQVAIVANSDWSNQQLHEQLARMGLADHVQFALTSLELTHTTRCPHSHAAVVEHLGLAVNELAFLGHDRPSLSAAHAAGLRTIALNYDLDVVAHAYLQRIAQLAGLCDAGLATSLKGPTAAYRRALHQSRRS